MRRDRALLVSVQLPGVDDIDHAASLKELGRVVTTLGFEVVGEVTQKRDKLAPVAVFGEGKLVEIAAWTGGKGVIPQGPKRKASKARARWEGEEPEESEEEETVLREKRRAD